MGSRKLKAPKFRARISLPKLCHQLDLRLTNAAAVCASVGFFVSSDPPSLPASLPVACSLARALSRSLSRSLSLCLCVCLPICLCLSVCLSVCLPTYPSIYLLIDLCLSVCLSFNCSRTKRLRSLLPISVDFPKVATCSAGTLRGVPGRQDCPRLSSYASKMCDWQRFALVSGAAAHTTGSMPLKHAQVGPRSVALSCDLLTQQSPHATYHV